MLGGLKAAFPSHSFIGEETSNDIIEIGDGPTWLVDPLDGTTNFVHGYPHCCVSIGLLDKKTATLGEASACMWLCTHSCAGVVYNPFLDELFVGGITHPSTCNGVPIHVSSTKDFEKALLATGFPKYREHRDFQMAVVNQLV